MGTFNFRIRISSMYDHRSKDVGAVVGTDAAYTTLPARLLHEIGVEPIGQRRILLEDGQRAFMDFSQARATINGESEVTIVVFGEDEAPALLGAYTLEGLALAVDPVEQRLVPTDLIMY